MRNRYFLDTSYPIALLIVRDEFHAAALEIRELLIADASQIITSQAIVLEIGNGLARKRYRHFGVQALELLERSPNIEVVSLTDELIGQATQLFRSRIDKEWSLVDCCSFLIMQNLGLELALTTDQHFLQAGFRALLREV